MQKAIYKEQRQKNRDRLRTKLFTSPKIQVSQPLSQFIAKISTILYTFSI